MKEKYTYDNGKVIALDITNSETKINVCDYQDNIEEIFTVENLIEELNERETNLIVQNSENHSALQKSALPILLTYCLGPLTFIALLMSLVSQNFLYFAVGGVVSGILAASGCFFEKRDDRIRKHEIEAADLELQKISEEKERYQALLEKLKSDKTRNNEKLVPSNEMTNIDYKQSLKNLRDYLLLYYKIGYYKEKLEKHYNEGTLCEKFAGKFDENQMILVKKYFEDDSKNDGK